ncbi:MAG: hypothetical protein IPL83_16320 [Bdellovibrionales bacterium]|nr:hypothetical protein [Bdellovibrionales bacterium]
MVWMDAPVGLRKGLPEDRTLGLGGKFSVGFIYGELKRPEDFTGATASISKTFLLPESVRTSVKNWILSTFPQLSTLANLNWGWQAKTGVLYWGDQVYPYFLTGPEVGNNIRARTAFSLGSAWTVTMSSNSVGLSMAKSAMEFLLFIIGVKRP